MLSAGAQMTLGTGGGGMTPQIHSDPHCPLTVSMKGNIGKQRINQGFRYVYYPMYRSLKMLLTAVSDRVPKHTCSQSAVSGRVFYW